MDNLVTIWVAPVITGLFVWFVTAKYGSRFIQKKENKSHIVALTTKEELPLTLKIENGDIPVGYYKLSETTAKRMEPEFYKDMKDYINQPGYIWFFSLFMLFIGIVNFQDDPSFSSSVIIWSIFNIIALFPWKSVLK